MTLDHLTTAQLNGQPVVVHQAHRFGSGGERLPGNVVRNGPVLVTVAAPVALSVDEVAAVLFRAWSLYPPVEDLIDDDHVRELVAESVVNSGCVQLDAALCHAANTAAADSEAAAFLAYCYQRATGVFAAARTKPGTRRRVQDGAEPA